MARAHRRVAPRRQARRGGQGARRVPQAPPGLSHLRIHARARGAEAASALALAWRCSHLREYLRPWKLVTLALGIALLVLGAFYYEAPDWDIPISLIMAVLAYLCAPWSLRVIVERRWRHWPAMLFL